MERDARAERGGSRNVVTSFWRRAELLRYDRSLEWGVVEEHSTGLISDEQVWRDFGDEPWRRWPEIVAHDLPGYQPAESSFVSRRLVEAAHGNGWAVVGDDEISLSLEHPGGQRVSAWFAPGAWLRVGAQAQSPDPWIETNDLSVIERIVAAIVRGDIDLSSDAQHEKQPNTLRWGSASWLTINPGAQFGQSEVERAAKRAIA